MEGSSNVQVKSVIQVGSTTKPLLDDNSYDLDLITPHLVKPEILSSSSTILERCMNKHSLIFGKHFILHSIVFRGESSSQMSTFLRQDHLQVALNDAESQCLSFLDRLLLISSHPDEDKIRVELRQYLSTAGDMFKQLHADLQTQFVRNVKKGIWNHFAETVQSRYYFLFRDYSDSNTKQFYKQEKMAQFLEDLVKSSTQDCSKFIKLLVGNPESAFNQDNVTKVCASFDSLSMSIQTAATALLAKNRKHEEYTKSQISAIIESKFVEPSKSYLKSALEDDPYCFTNEGKMRAAVNGAHKNNVLLEVATFAKAACLEEAQRFQESCLVQIDDKLRQVVQYGIRIQAERKQAWSKMFQDLENQLPDVVKKISKANQIGEHAMESVISNLLGSVRMAKAQRKSLPMSFGSTAEPPNVAEVEATSNLNVGISSLPYGSSNKPAHGEGKESDFGNGEVPLKKRPRSSLSSVQNMN